ncbi:hypothetical protein LMG28727_06725 [Paraburkholderia kirstenboschensis]|nr:hypothetical protein LMG28727_06725 [Paraburkholderia kirstenboschensis]
MTLTSRYTEIPDLRFFTVPSALMGECGFPVVIL